MLTDIRCEQMIFIVRANIDNMFIFFSRTRYVFPTYGRIFSIRFEHFIKGRRSSLFPLDTELICHQLTNQSEVPSVIYYNERRRDVSYPRHYSEHAFSELSEVKVYGELLTPHHKYTNRKLVPLLTSCTHNCL